MTDTLHAQDEDRIPDPRRDRDPREPEQPPPVDDPGTRIEDDPVDIPPDTPPAPEPERRDPPTGEPGWRDPGGGPAHQV
jgi:hypothetical protein